MNMPITLQVSALEVPVVLVGGGSILVDPDRTIKGVSSLVRPQHFDVRMIHSAVNIYFTNTFK